MTARPLDAHAQFACEALHHRILSADEERALARRWRESGHTDTAARDALVTHNLRLVYDLAYRYARHATNMEQLDLVQEGTIGLMHAIDKYDERTNNRLTTYASWWIRQAMGRTLQEQDAPIRLPYHVAEARRRVLRLGAVTEEEAALLALPRYTASLDTEIPGADGLTVADTVPAQGEEEAREAAEEEARRVQVRDALASAHLTPRERMVVAFHYGIEPNPQHVSRPATLAELGDMLGMSRERVWQIEAAALVKLRARLTRDATSGAVTAQVKTKARKRPAREPRATMGQIGSAA